MTSEDSPLRNELEEGDDARAAPGRAFFFLGPGVTREPPGYPHLAVVLAEGLLSLGWHISSDVQAWQFAPNSDYLFPGDGLKAATDATLIVISEDWFLFQAHPLLPDLSAFGRVPLVYLDRSDLGRATRLIHSPILRNVDLILRCHASGYFKYPGNVRPSVFGISNRIQEACFAAFSKTKRGVLWNYRSTQYPHSVRHWAEKEVRPYLSRSMQLQSSTDALDEIQPDPYEELMRRQTGRRHFRNYYQHLGSALLCSCFGGWFLLPVKQEEAGFVCMWGRRLLNFSGLKTMAIAQWDSWRLWEAFAAGSTVIHVDFEKHRLQFPGPVPEPMKHYIAIDLHAPEKSLSAVLEDTDTLLRIGAAGREWALKSYTPKPIAKRVLRELSLI